MGKVLYALDITGQSGKHVIVKQDETGLEFASGSFITVTYAEFDAAVIAATLVPSMYYLISDFETVHNILDGDTTTGDIHTGATERLIVLAISENQVSPIAYSPDYPNDIIHYEHPATADTSDIAFFDGGSHIAGLKGVITYRKDTLQNVECWYDFRNVVFRRWRVDATAWVASTPYFKYDIVSHSGVLYIATSDNPGSIVHPHADLVNWSMYLSSESCYSWTSNLAAFTVGSCNVTNLILNDVDQLSTFSYYNYVKNFSMGPTDRGQPTRLNNTTFQFSASTGSFTDNVLGVGCYCNTITADCVGNNFGETFINNVTSKVAITESTFNGATGNIFHGGLDVNAKAGFNQNVTHYMEKCSFGEDCYANITEAGFTFNNIGPRFHTNVIAHTFSNNDIGQMFNSNKIYSAFTDNIIGDVFTTNAINTNFKRNTVGYNAHDNVIMNGFQDNTVLNYFEYNTMEEGIESNYFGNNFSTNVTAAGLCVNIFGDLVQSNTIGSNFQYNAFGSNVRSNIFGNNFNNNTFGSNVTGNTFGTNNHNNTFGNGIATNVFGNTVYYNKVGSEFAINTIPTFIYNEIQNSFTSNSMLQMSYCQIGSQFISNTFADTIGSCKIGDMFDHNDIGGNFGLNVIDGGFTYNTIGDNFRSNHVAHNSTGNTIGEGFAYNTILDTFTENKIATNFQYNNIKTALSSIDFTLSNHVYEPYNCDIYYRGTTGVRLSYSDDNDDTIFADITA